MWAVFRYSTGRLAIYCTEEREAQFVVNALVEDDAALGIMVPDWGYKLMTVTESVDELCNGLDA